MLTPVNVVALACVTANPELSVPVPVVAEWWRSGHREKERAKYIRAMHVIATDEHVARLAGNGLAAAREIFLTAGIALHTDLDEAVAEVKRRLEAA